MWITFWACVCLSWAYVNIQGAKMIKVISNAAHTIRNTYNPRSTSLQFNTTAATKLYFEPATKTTGTGKKNRWGKRTDLLDNGAVLGHGEELPVAHNVPTAKVVDVVTVGSCLDAEVLGTPPHDRAGGARASHGDLGGVAGPRGIGGLLVPTPHGAVQSHLASHTTSTNMWVLQTCTCQVHNTDDGTDNWAGHSQ